MAMISLLMDADAFKVMTLFGISPGSRFNRKEIKEKTRLNNIPLDRALKAALASGVLERDGNYYSLNQEDEKSKELASLVSWQYKSMKSLPLDVYFLLTDFMGAASLERGIELYLFGSYSKLVYSKKSDVDIAVLCTKTTDKAALKKVVRKLEARYGKNIELHFFDKQSFHKSHKDPLVKDILKNGLRLIG